MKQVTRLATALAVSLAASSVWAHEFWIAPRVFEVSAGAPLQADLKVGSHFEGSNFSFVPANFKRFELSQGGVRSDVIGRPGDQPALNQTVDGQGLVTVVHVTRDYKLTYTDWQKFVDFVEHKDFKGALARHKARGLPETGFTETYSRHAKSLMAAGQARGADRKVGLETEIVAETNPYLRGVSKVTVQVLYQGNPRGRTQVELFERAPDGDVVTTYHRTDGAGRVTLPVKPGHEYLVDSVVLRELAPKKPKDPVWESLWASLTFRVPD